MNWKTVISLMASVAPILVVVGLAGELIFPSALWFLFLLSPFVGIFFGHWALRKQKASAIKLTGTARRTAIASTVTGYVEVGLIILAFLGHPYYPSRLAANEASAIGSLRTLYYATSKYAKAHPNNGFPERMDTLAVPFSMADSEWSIDPALAKGERFGYKYHYVVAAPDAGGRDQHWKVSADPVEQDKTGVRHFFVDETGIIRWGLSQPADEKSQSLQ